MAEFEKSADVCDDKMAAKEKALKALMNARSEILDKAGLNSDKVVASGETRNFVIKKPVFIPSHAQTFQSMPLDQVDEDDAEVDSRQLFLEAIEADKNREKKSFEERRITGTPFDINSIDDADGADEAQEVNDWRERERRRLEWERSEMEREDEEHREMERRKNMTEEERLKQDRDKQLEWEKQQAEKGGEYKFLQKYYHKGSFYQESNDPIFARNYAEATGADRGVHRDTLPSVLQVRDFGKKGRSKWTHLSGEDTTAFDFGWGDKKNEMNYRPIERMGGMKGDLSNPSFKRQKRTFNAEKE